MRMCLPCRTSWSSLPTRRSVWVLRHKTEGDAFTDLRRRWIKSFQTRRSSAWQSGKEAACSFFFFQHPLEGYLSLPIQAGLTGLRRLAADLGSQAAPESRSLGTSERLAEPTQRPQCCRGPGPRGSENGRSLGSVLATLRGPLCPSLQARPLPCAPSELPFVRRSGGAQTRLSFGR